MRNVRTLQAPQAPCRSNPDLWFSASCNDIDKAISICKTKCPFTSVCLRQAEREGEKHGVWGGRDFGSNPSTEGKKLCRNNLHEKTGKGSCRECEKERVRRYNKSSTRKVANARNNKKRKPANVIGGTCKKGHTLTVNNTKIRDYDKALVCTECSNNIRPIIKPVIVKKEVRDYARSLSSRPR